MIMEREEVINGIRKDGQKVGEDNFPIEIFPQLIQSIILTFNRNENSVLDFIATAMLSAASAAMGNSFRIRIKGLWTVNSALYIVFFGKPGLGKSPPIEAAYRPIRQKDEERLRQYQEERKLYDASMKDGKSTMEKPTLVQTILSDCTEEAMLLAHYNNPDGISIVYDEIIGLINSVYRYNKSTLNEKLLTAYSGGELRNSRCCRDLPVFVKQPCINIIGTTQTALLKQISENWMSNGFLDRVIFVHPQNAIISLWIEEDEKTLAESIMAQKDWDMVINKIYGFKKSNQQLVLSFAPDARKRFYSWQNSIISSINAISDETQVETREMKLCIATAKIALIIQILRHVCGEAEINAIDLTSVESAISVCAYYDESYEYFKNVVGMGNMNNSKKVQFMNALNAEFVTADAQKVGRELDVNERTVKRWLKDLVRKGGFERLEHGHYRKK